MSNNYTADQMKNDAKDVAEKAGNELREGAQRVADDARKAVDNITSSEPVERVKQHVADAADAARETYEAAKERGAEYAHIARDEAQRLYADGKRRAGEVAHQAEDYYDEMSDMVRRHPAQALGIAAGVGFLIGLVLARR